MRCFGFLSLIIIFGHAVFAQQQSVTVHFGFDKYTLNEGEKQKIDSAFRTKRIAFLRIDAHCDSIGDNMYNFNLSNRRAFEVKNTCLQNIFCPIHLKPPNTAKATL